jgi:multicomponent Na+:H+ antiporter subunit D
MHLVPALLLIPLATAFATSLVSGRAPIARALGTAGAASLLAAAVMLVWHVHRFGTVRVTFGGWATPYGIQFVADPLAAAMVLITALLGLICLAFHLEDTRHAPDLPTLVPMVHALLAGVVGAFLTADLFNLYVWFELVLMAALGLIVCQAGARHLEAALKYFVLNAAAAFVLLIAVAFTYALTGHLNFDAIARASAEIDPERLLAVAAALTVALLIKAGAFPVFAWLPAAYHTLPIGLMALFAGLTTKVAVYALLRLLRGIMTTLPPVFFESLGWIAAATMLAGVLGAAYHWDLRRILAFHIISQIGYMLLGIALASPAADAATVLYVLHHIIVKANLFLIAGLVYRYTGTYDLRQAGGLYEARPWFSVLFLVPALSLVGLPPLSGFWAKFLILRESLASGHEAWAAVALVVSLLTLYSMLKVWMEAFWKPHPQPTWNGNAMPSRSGRLLVPVCVLAGLTLWIGLWPEAIIQYAERAAAAIR